MRLIDVGEVSPSDMLIAIADYVGDTKKKTVMCRRAVQGVQRLLDIQPTIDQWHYPSKGEYPTEDTSYFVTLEHLCGFKERFVTTASYYKEYGWGGFEPLFYRVVAWMPLPEPYEPQESVG